MNLEDDKPDTNFTQISTANRRFNWVVGISGIVLILIGIILLRLEFRIPATGTIYLTDEQYIYAPYTALAESIEVYEGQVVAADEVVLRLASTALREERLDTALALAEIEHRLAVAQLELDRIGRSPDAAEAATVEERLDILRRLQKMREDTLERFANLDAMRAISGLQVQQERMNRLREEITITEQEYLSGLMREGYWDGLRQQARLGVVHLQQERERKQLRMAWLDSEIAAHTLRAPFDGMITALPIRYPGERIEQGQLVFQIADPRQPYRVRAYAGQRNIDLIRTGAEARMASEVFDSPLSGYIMGQVIEVAPEPDPLRSSEAGEPQYRVTIAVESTPFPLVLGSTVHTEIILGKRNMVDILLNRREDLRDD